MPQITVTHYFISCIYNLFEAIFERKPILLDPCDVMSYILRDLGRLPSKWVYMVDGSPLLIVVHLEGEKWLVL